MELTVNLRFLALKTAQSQKTGQPYHQVSALYDDQKEFSYFVKDPSPYSKMEKLTALTAKATISVYNMRLSLDIISVEVKK